jgi:hypothetical protein
MQRLRGNQYTVTNISEWEGIARSVQRVATGWKAEGVGVRVPVGKDLSLFSVVQTGFGAMHPTMQLVPGSL